MYIHIQKKLVLITPIKWTQRARGLLVFPTIFINCWIFSPDGQPTIFCTKEDSSATGNLKNVSWSPLPIYAPFGPPRPFMPGWTVQTDRRITSVGRSVGQSNLPNSCHPPYRGQKVSTWQITHAHASTSFLQAWLSAAPQPKTKVSVKFWRK